jgi:membrane protein implicated in regulation of membrane protease activity
MEHEMDNATVWWVLAGLVVVAELLTGSLYLLMVALGLAAAALAAHAGLGVAAQVALGAALGGAATMGWHLRQRKRQAGGAPVTANKDVNLDVGETVQVPSFCADGTASVRYRGADWQAQMAQGHSPRGAGTYKIAEVLGNKLLLN